MWNGNAEKFNDTALTSGKEGNLAVFGGGVGGGERRDWKNTEHVRYKVYDCDNVVSNGGWGGGVVSFRWKLKF